ncbi:NB-ARC domain-containing disease resistance protein [Prunus dulcis]|uniref:NB-ARC domain-containing disease resistance protein n=1 Tax=Prunus dulcis TaxID=3755 RepID=A0A4Y1QY59_PRUDU|nr:NB-ARC domain-containing disease resistance protein [Prunus dulcis]
MERTGQTCSYVALLKSSSFGTENQPSNDQRLCKEFVDLGKWRERRQLCVLQLFETKSAALQVREKQFCNLGISLHPNPLPKQAKMAAALIREALISASIEVLCDRVTSAEFIDLFRQKKLDEPLLMNLKTTLLILFAVLNDAEEKEIVNPAVRSGLTSSSMLSLMQRTYLMRLTLKLCDASWKIATPASEMGGDEIRADLEASDAPVVASCT